MPLTLSVEVPSALDPDYLHSRRGRTVRLEKKLKLRATTSTDSTLVAGGDVKRTKKQLAAGEPTKFTAMLTQSNGSS